ncbi:MAG TPA: cupin domain-containing protein [Dongiaceae bacterium]|nr:cupin domain-containing protein [Dongiaceae bacterium]
MNIVSPTTLLLPETKSGPNNPTLPVVIYRGVFDRQVAEKDKLFQQCFGQSGWKGVWKNGIYDYHHFHPSSHEVLGIAKGSVHLMLGGENGEELMLEAGDVVVLPAGTVHKRISASENLVVIGGYPPGQEDYEVCRTLADAKSTEDVAQRIAQTAVPKTDPLYGEAGPLPSIWG